MGVFFNFVSLCYPSTFHGRLSAKQLLSGAEDIVSVSWLSSGKGTAIVSRLIAPSVCCQGEPMQTPRVFVEKHFTIFTL